MESVKLLLVDDLKENLLTLEAVLRRDGIELLQAGSGAEALELLLIHDVALAIIDVQMPSMDGFELAELMRGTERTRRVPIIFLTAGSQSEYRLFRGYESGAVDFLYKPFDPRILTSKAEIFIELYRQRQELTRQRDALKENEGRLRMALAAAQLATWNWDVLNDQLTWSEEFARRQGIAPQQVPRRLTEFLALVHPADVERVKHSIQQSLSRGDRYEFEFRLLKPDGTARTAVVMAKVERDPHGRAIRFVGVERDVTIERQAERELRSLSDNSPNVIVRFDRELRHVFVNQIVEAVSGIAPQDYLGKTNRELGMPSDLCDLWDSAIQSVFETAKPQTIQFTYETPAGDRRYECQLVPETDTENRVEHVLGVTRDMTVEWSAARDLSHAKAIAESANAAKDQFLAVLSHELRNPLAPIRMLVSLWEMDASIRPEFREGLQMIRRNVDLECRLIDDMLDVNRIANGKIELKQELVNVNDVIGFAMQIVDPDAAAKRLTIHVDQTAQRTTVLGDAARIQQILWNLLNNTVKFTPPGGHIYLRVTNPTESLLRIDVQDTGIGIESEALEHIFDAFQQGGSHVTRQFGGLGLGLAISKALAELHGGQLHAASEGKDQGATFTLELNVAPADDQQASPAGTGSDQFDSNSGQNEGKLRILLVEDQVALARLTKRLLARIGHDVIIAGSVTDALEIWRDNEFDLVISDFGLPDGNGCDLIKQILADHPVPAIALTGFGMEEDIARAHDAGFLAHLTKPVSFDHLNRTIEQVMN